MSQLVRSSREPRLASASASSVRATVSRAAADPASSGEPLTSRRPRSCSVRSAAGDAPSTGSGPRRYRERVARDERNDRVLDPVWKDTDSDDSSPDQETGGARPELVGTGREIEPEVAPVVSADCCNPPPRGHSEDVDRCALRAPRAALFGGRAPADDPDGPAGDSRWSATGALSRLGPRGRRAGGFARCSGVCGSGGSRGLPGRRGTSRRDEDAYQQHRRCASEVGAHAAGHLLSSAHAGCLPCRRVIASTIPLLRRDVDLVTPGARDVGARLAVTDILLRCSGG